MYLICKRDARGQSVYKSHTNRMDVLQLFCFMVHERIKGALSPCVWHEERFYTAGPVPWNGAGELAGGKPWVSMPSNWNEFIIPTRVSFLSFGLSKT